MTETYQLKGHKFLLGRIGKPTPRECFNTQEFPSSFKLVNQSNCRLKEDGNSVVIPVIERIAKEIAVKVN